MAILKGFYLKKRLYIEVAVPKFMLKGRENADKEFIGVKELMASDASDKALSNMMIAKIL